MGSVLDGIRILDFGRYIAGPFCGMLLADMGAEVIRIEKIDGSEDRYTIPVGQGADGETSVGAMFLQMNRNKLGLTLNPMKPEGREIVRKLVATADVVIANLPAPTLKTMGLDYESLRAIKSDIILTAVSTFGSIGPYSDRVGFDGVAAAMCGMMHLTGNPDEPMKAYTPWVDYGTASGAAFGTLAALIHRDKTGEGQIVEGTLLGTALAFNNALLVEQAMIQPDRIGTGNRGQIAAPSDAFCCKGNEWIIVQVIGQPLFERWVRLMGEEEQWLFDSRFKDDISRGNNGAVISERMQRWCAEQSRERRSRLWRRHESRLALYINHPKPCRTLTFVMLVSSKRSNIQVLLLLPQSARPTFDCRVRQARFAVVHLPWVNTPSRFSLN